MRKLIAALAIVAALAIPAAASASVTAYGRTYSDAQVAQLCGALRPGSAEYVRLGCATLP